MNLEFFMIILTNFNTHQFMEVLYLMAFLKLIFLNFHYLFLLHLFLNFFLMFPLEK